MDLKLVPFFMVLLISLVWILTYPSSFKNMLANFYSKRGLSTIALTIIMFIQSFTHILDYTSFTFLQPLRITGLIVLFLGVFLAVWAKLTMKKNWGVPAQHDLKVQRKLVTNGPFSFTRNPIYLGLFLLFLGFQLAQSSLFVFLIIPLAYFIYRSVLVEEKLLEKHFGRKYLEYKKVVPRFIPRF